MDITTLKRANEINQLMGEIEQQIKYWEASCGLEENLKLKCVYPGMQEEVYVKSCTLNFQHLRDSAINELRKELSILEEEFKEL